MSRGCMSRLTGSLFRDVRCMSRGGMHKGSTVLLCCGMSTHIGRDSGGRDG